MRKTYPKICPVCGKKFQVASNRINKAKYCSHKCHSNSPEGILLRKNLRSDNWKGKKRDIETIEKMASKKRGVKLSKEHRTKISNGLKGTHSGEKCSFWRGGVTPENRLFRASVEYRLWREAVFSRDNWTCQECGERGGKLNAHHIREFAKYRELRTSIENGVTLCRKCHNLKHKKYAKLETK